MVRMKVIHNEVCAAACCRACRRLPKLRKPLPAPEALPVAKSPPATAAQGEALDQLGLAAMPRRRDGSVIDWGTGVMSAWKPSERDALSALDDFLEIGMLWRHTGRQPSCACQHTAYSTCRMGVAMPCCSRTC